ncbi:MAG: hypothetical protein GVY19_00385 [Bacteroidetes bacterium]|jgi:lipopolysaccharide biosynthesis glycosyltransferase|nr:hypothetical protein [Bacteroidota bacterium]
MPQMENSTSKTQPIHIACAIDDTFATPLAVTLTSLFHSNKNNYFHIHLFSAKLTDNNVLKLKNLIPDEHAELTYYKLEQEQFDNLPTSDRISHASYYRLLMPRNISEEVNRFIYLDADVLVLGDLIPMWEQDIEGNIIGAIHDITGTEWRLNEKHGYNARYNYFNAGVLLIDKQAWLQNNITDQVLTYISEYPERCRFHDQDGLNAILHGKRKPISPVWNQQFAIYFVDKSFLDDIYGNNELENALNKPGIVHFNTVEKPWHYTCEHPYRKKFDFYLKLSGFNKTKESITIKKILKKTYIKLIGWVSYHRKLYLKQKKE